MVYIIIFHPHTHTISERGEKMTEEKLVKVSNSAKRLKYIQSLINNRRENIGQQKVLRVLNHVDTDSDTWVQYRVNDDSLHLIVVYTYYSKGFDNSMLNITAVASYTQFPMKTTRFIKKGIKSLQHSQKTLKHVKLIFDSKLNEYYRNTLGIKTLSHLVTTGELLNEEDQTYLIDLDLCGNLLYTKWFTPEDGEKLEVEFEKLKLPEEKKLKEFLIKEKTTLSYGTARRVREWIRDYLELKLDSVKAEHEKVKIYVAYQEYDYKHPKLVVVLKTPRTTEKQAAADLLNYNNEGKSSGLPPPASSTLEIALISKFWNGMYHEFNDTGNYSRVRASELIKSAVRHISFDNPHLKYIAINDYTEGTTTMLTKDFYLNLKGKDVLVTDKKTDNKIFRLEKFKCFICGKVASFTCVDRYFCGKDCYDKHNK